MCEECLSEEVLLDVEWSPQDLVDIQLKEHTPRFKKAVEKCKERVKSDKTPEEVARMCFASVTKTFKSSGYPIFLSENKEIELETDESIFRIQLISPIEPVVQSLKLPMDAISLHAMLSDDLKHGLYELLKNEYPDE